MNEEHMCNHCSEGFIRPLQCNLNEAISLCSNIDCDFYLYDTPKDCLISKSALDSSEFKYKDWYAGSRFSNSSLSPAPSHSSSTDREVELLLNFPVPNTALPVIHSEFRPGLGRFKPCLSPHNVAEPEFSVELEGKGSEMTLSRLDLNFEQPSQHEMPTNAIETEVKKNEDEFKEMLNIGEPLMNAQHTLLDEVLSSWLDDINNLPTSSNYDSIVENVGNDFTLSKLPDAGCSKTLIHSASSAFDEILPQKVLAVKEKDFESSNKEICENNKLAKDCKEGQINFNELNFLSPAGSGISEDSGYNDDDFSRGHYKGLMYKSSLLTPIKNKISDTNVIISNNSSLKLNNSFTHPSSFNLSLSNLFTFLDLNLADKRDYFLNGDSDSSCLVQVPLNNNNLKLKDSNPISLTFGSSLDTSFSSLLMEPNFSEDLGTDNMPSTFSSKFQVGGQTFSPIKNFPTEKEAEKVCLSQNFNSSIAALNKDLNLVSQEIYTPVDNNLCYSQTDCPNSKMLLNSKDNVQFANEEKSFLTDKQSFINESKTEIGVSLKEICSSNLENNNNGPSTDIKLSLNSVNSLPNGVVQKLSSTLFENAKNHCSTSLPPEPSILPNSSSTHTSNLSSMINKNEILSNCYNESRLLPSLKNAEGFSKDGAEYRALDSGSSISKNHRTSMKGEKHLKKLGQQVEVEVDPWSIPEIYIDELDIEVTLESLQKSLDECNTESAVEVCLKEVTSTEISSPTMDSSPKFLEISPCNVNFFKPITLTPEVINLKDYPFNNISHFENAEPVRLSVGFKSPAKIICNESAKIVNETGVQFAKSRYFSSLLSSVVFDESFLHTNVENNTDEENNSIENHHSNYFFDQSNSVSKNCLQKLSKCSDEYFNKTRESKMAIICVDTNDEPQIYLSGKRKASLIDNISTNENQKCSDVKRQKLFHKYNGNVLTESFLTNKLKLSSENVQNKPLGLSKILESLPFYKEFDVTSRNGIETAKKFQNHSKCSSKLNADQESFNSRHFVSIGPRKSLVNSPELKNQISVLRRKSDINLPLISCQRPPNNKAINTTGFSMLEKLEYYGDLRKSPVSFHKSSLTACEEESDLSNLCDSYDCRIFNYASVESNGVKNPLDLPPPLENTASKVQSNLTKIPKNLSSLEDKSGDFLNYKIAFSGRQYFPSPNFIECKNKKINPKVKNIKDNIPYYNLENKCSHNAKINSNKVSIPKYMNSLLAPNSFNSDYYYKNLPKRKYIEKEVNFKNNDCVDNIPSLLRPNSTDSQVLDFLKNSGWAVTPCSPLINYQVPSNAKSPTLIPPALKSLYGKAGSDVILWTMTDANIPVKDLPSTLASNLKSVNKPVHKNKNVNLVSAKNLRDLKLKVHRSSKLNKLSQISKPQKFSNSSFSKTNFLCHGDPKLPGRLSSEKNTQSPENDNGKSTEELRNSNLSALKIGNNNIFLPSLSILKRINFARNQKQPEENEEVENEEFIELPDDNLAYKEVCSNGFYSVKAPTPELAYSHFNSYSAQSYDTFIEKTKKLKSKRSEKKSIKATAPQTIPISETASDESTEFIDSSQKLAENNLVESIKKSDQPPSFYCVAHKSKTYIFHRKDT